MPGVLIIEALAQVGAVAILSLDENKGKIAFFGGINKCRFKGKVKPGDKLRLETKIIRHKGPMGRRGSGCFGRRQGGRAGGTDLYGGGSTMIRKVLIANRGEIAVRIIRGMP